MAARRSFQMQIFEKLKPSSMRIVGMHVSQLGIGFFLQNESMLSVVHELFEQHFNKRTGANVSHAVKVGTLQTMQNGE